MDGEAVERLLTLVEQRRPDQALSLVRSLLDAGRAPDEVIADVLGPVQVEVGRRWEDGRWTVAQEHAATGVVQTALGLLANAVPPSRPRGQIVLACVEQEWHSLAARMLHERLRARGWESHFLGASTPADDLHTYLADGDVVAAVVSCQIEMFLPGAARAVRASHEAGLPVVVGGAALGPSPARAVALGADAWCPDVDALDATLAGWADAPPTSLADAHDDRGEHLMVLAASSDVVRDVVTGSPGLADHVPSVEQVVDHLVAFLAAAVLVDDPSVLSDHVAWLRRVVVARGGRAVDVEDLLEAVADVLPATVAGGTRMLRAARGSAAGRGER